MVRNRKQYRGQRSQERESPIRSRKKLVEWVILRSDDAGADFARYVAFIAANPTWPSIVTLRRKAEAAAVPGPRRRRRASAPTSRNDQPLSAKGKFALARALLAQGDRKGAEALVREAWRNDGFSQEVEMQGARSSSANS